MEASIDRRAARKRFLLGPPQDRDGALQLFSLLFHLAREQSAHGKTFALPFAALFRLAYRNRPSLQQLERFCSSRLTGDDWPRVLSHAATASTDASQEMLFLLLRQALDYAPIFDIEGARVCRVLAAVGQTLKARDLSIRERNVALAQTYRLSAQQRLSPSPPLTITVTATPVPSDLSGEMEFQRIKEQGGALRFPGMSLWHASYIGPLLADKSENQDATFAVAAHGDSPAPVFVFALADGVSTSMGSRVAANAIVRRFCEFVMPHMTSSEPLTAAVLVQAAQQTQQSLDELATALLETPNGYIFDAVRGSSLQSKAAIRILHNTVQPRASAIPPALTATLIAGIGQPSKEQGGYDIDLLRIGDGVVEQISADGVVSAVMQTDPEVVEIAQAIGPGPRSRALLQQQQENLETCRVQLRPGESLLISSDGLVRGHQQSVTGKLSEIVGEGFWKAELTADNETALHILRAACRSADELFGKDPQQVLFADNVSLILIRCADLPAINQVPVEHYE